MHIFLELRRIVYITENNVFEPAYFTPLQLNNITFCITIASFRIIWQQRAIAWLPVDRLCLLFAFKTWKLEHQKLLLQKKSPTCIYNWGRPKHAITLLHAHKVLLYYHQKPKYSNFVIKYHLGRNYCKWKWCLSANTTPWR